MNLGSKWKISKAITGLHTIGFKFRTEICNYFIFYSDLPNTKASDWDPKRIFIDWKSEVIRATPEIHLMILGMDQISGHFPHMISKTIAYNSIVIIMITFSSNSPKSFQNLKISTKND